MRPLPRLCLIFLAVLLTQSAMAQIRGLEEISKLAADGRCTEAYAIMEPLEFDMAGDIEFDLLFAYCALEIGKTGLATLALDRVLALDPYNKSARGMLARAYYLLNQLDGARREFEMLLSLNPTPATRETAGQYLEAIAAARPGKKNQFSGYVEVGLGHDTNVTGGTASDFIYFPSVNQNLRLAPEDVEDEDNYGSLAAGLSYVRKPEQDRMFYAGVEMLSRSHQERDDRDYLFAILRTGYRYGWRNQSLGIGILAGNWELDGEAYQDIETLELEWRATWSRRNQFGLYGRYDRYRHRASVDELFDYDDARVQFVLSRLLGERADKQIGIAVDFGREDAINDREDGNLEYAALKLSTQVTFSDQVSGFLILSSQKDEYDRVNPFFDKKRNESQKRAVAGLSWSVRKKISLRTTLGLWETESNLSIYDDVSDSDFSIALRWDMY